MQLVYYFIVQLFLAIVASQVSEDPCTKPYNDGGFLSYEKAVACSRSFELDNKTRSEHLKNLRNLLQFYVFIDINQRSPNYQVPSNVNLYEGLNKIEAKNFTSENEFHDAIHRLFLSANDGHLNYNANCASIFTYFQPFPLVALRGEHGNLIVKVIDNLEFIWYYPQYMNATHNIDINKFAGKEVLLINGQLPLDFLQSYADSEVGLSRDPNSRLAQVFARTMPYYGSWGTSYGALARTSLTPNIKEIIYTFKVGYGEEKVTIPYVAQAQGPWFIKDKETLYNRFCRKKSGNSRIMKSDSEPTEPVYGVKQITELKPDVMLGQSRAATGLFNPIKRGNTLLTYELNEDTIVLVIPTFSSYDINALSEEMADHLKFISDSKATKLILDISNNGGGAVCLSDFLAEFLFPDTYRPLETDQKFNPALQVLAEAWYQKGGPFNFDGFTRPNGTKYESWQGFLGPKVYHRGDNSNSTYTNKYASSCYESPFKAIIKANNNKPRFRSQNIAVVSNGICYSACARFINRLQLNHNVTKTYSVGGDNNIWKQATVGSMTGGAISTSRTVTQFAEIMHLENTEGMPKEFTLPVHYSFTHIEVYNNGDSTPLEFKWVPATKRLAYDQESVLNPYKVWETVAKQF